MRLLFSVEQGLNGLRFRVDRRPIHSSPDDEWGVLEITVHGCVLPHQELSAIQDHLGEEVVYWTSSSKEDELDFWLGDLDLEFLQGPYACTGLEELPSAYKPCELIVRLIAVEDALSRQGDAYQTEVQERSAADRALRSLANELRMDLLRARTKREFLESVKRNGVERLSGMAEAFEIALNRLEKHAPTT